MSCSALLRHLAITFAALSIALAGAACSSDTGGTGDIPGADPGNGYTTQGIDATTGNGTGTDNPGTDPTPSDAGNTASDAGSVTPPEDSEPGPCVPDCAGKGCGDDGCGGTCGVCAVNQTCSDDGTCECAPDCTGKACGDDGCGGTCGSCTDGSECTPEGSCGCAPACDGKSCGDDGCGGSCGECGEGESCNAGGQCDPCVPSCVGMECGDDGCGGQCGDCGTNGTCTEGICSCTPDCTGKTCGDDGCGGECGDCANNEFCNPAGTCECAPNCAGKECGDDGCGGECGGCPADLSCTSSGQCGLAYVPGALGSYCGASSECASEILDPATGMMIANEAWPDCMNLACDSGFCTGPGLPGVALLSAATCSKSCTISMDTMNNVTGLPGADGIEDPGAPSDCAGFVDGPLGSEWHCVNFGTAGQPGNAFCMPGTTYESCDAGTQCPDGEGCVITTFGGLGQRCFTKTQSGAWGDGAMMTTQCNEDPYDGDIDICEQGICYTMLGCSSFCETSLDCDTTQLFEESGCDGATNTCKGWPSKNCLSDADCSAWYCNAPSPLFSNIPEYTPQLCFPNVCDTVDDCPSDFYCRWFYNGEAGPLADWEHRCLARDPEGVGLGEPCDSDPTDNIPGDTCQAQDLCVGGYCSALCEDDTQCGEEQVCRTEEANLDTNGDGIGDTVLPLDYCITMPGKAGPCMSEATCTDEQTCNIYETKVPDDKETLTVKGVCHDSDPAWGTLGQSCGAASAEVERCETFCLGANEPAGIAGICSQPCETHTDCPDTVMDEVTYTFRCQTYAYSFGLDLAADEDNMYIGLCVPNALGSSGTDCSDDFTCEADNEACTALSINFGPDYAAGTDHVCIDITNDGTFTPTLELGETCDPMASQDACKTMYCLADATGISGVCTAPCDPANDQCPEGMACEEEVIYPRDGVYAENKGSIWRCNTSASVEEP